MTRTRTDLHLGIFQRFDRADGAIRRLIDLGVAEDRISLVAAADTPAPTEDVEEIPHEPARVMPAVVAGGAVGSVLGGLTAAAGVAATGGAGLLFVGPLLAGAAGGGVAGGFLGAMTRRGVRSDVADLYDQALASGEVLVAVEPADDGAGPDADTIERTLRQGGARTLELPAS